MLPVFVWASLVPPLPMLALSRATSKPRHAAGTDRMALGPGAWLAVLYVAVVSTVLGYSLWGAVLSRHPAAQRHPLCPADPGGQHGLSPVWCSASG